MTMNRAALLMSLVLSATDFGAHVEAAREDRAPTGEGSRRAAEREQEHADRQPVPAPQVTRQQRRAAERAARKGGRHE